MIKMSIEWIYVLEMTKIDETSLDMSAHSNTTEEPRGGA